MGLHSLLGYCAQRPLSEVPSAYSRHTVYVGDQQL